MNRTSLVLMLLSIGILSSCQPDNSQSQESSSGKSTAEITRSLDDQTYLVQLVKESAIADNERSLVHVSHTCTLKIDSQAYAVIDIRELVKGATTARGINQIVLLNAEHQFINRIEYGSARPLFCDDNKLYLYGDLIPDGQTDEGNVLVFTDSGFVVTTNKEDLNSILPLQ